MDWLQQNLSVILLVLLFVAFIFKGKIMSTVLGIKSISVRELHSKIKSNPESILIWDVRSDSEFNSTRIKEATLLPLPSLGSKIPEMIEKYKDQEIAVICQSGMRSASGASMLQKAGFTKVYNVVGGMMAWQREGLPTE